ncbi:MAG: substrate-binding domain-containing protein [Theionarchaea archaeon]|nr:substrate-binding domain-containing protein [Theionarchaea archaeon]
MRERYDVKKISCLIMIVVLMLPGCVDQQADTINISGAWALYPMMVKWAEEYNKIYPDIRIDVSAGGAGKGMADTLGGLVDIGMVSREIYPEEIEKGAFYIAVVKDAVIPIFNKDNPYADMILSKGVPKEMFYNLYITGTIQTWGDILGDPEITDAVQVYTRSDACGAAQTWAVYLSHAQEDLKGVGVYGDPGIVEAVANDVLGIGYANLNFAYDPNTGGPSPGVSALPMDLDGNRNIDAIEDCYTTKFDVIDAIIGGVYPSPPARDLYVVTRGKPTGMVRDFLIWILTEGQAYISETGYISLGEQRIEEELKKVEE